LPSTSLEVLLGVLIAAGLLLFGIGTAMLRSTREAPQSGGQPAPQIAQVQQPKWPCLVDETLTQTDAPLRIDMIERLALLGNTWSRDVLQQAEAEERDPAVRRAIETALL
jgi:hypothetical protein